MSEHTDMSDYWQPSGKISLVNSGVEMAWLGTVTLIIVALHPDTWPSWLVLVVWAALWMGGCIGWLWLIHLIWLKHNNRVSEARLARQRAQWAQEDQERAQAFQTQMARLLESEE